MLAAKQEAELVALRQEIAQSQRKLMKMDPNLEEAKELMDREAENASKADTLRTAIKIAKEVDSCNLAPTHFIRLTPNVTLPNHQTLFGRISHNQFHPLIRNPSTNPPRLCYN